MALISPSHRLSGLLALGSMMRRYWQDLGLCAQFALAMTLVIAIGMTVLASWVSSRISRGVLDNAAANGAFYVVGFIEHHVQDVASRQELTTEARDQLDKVLTAAMTHRTTILALRIWTRGGRLVYSSTPAPIGEIFPVSQEIKSAWEGAVVPIYNDLEQARAELGSSADAPAFEIYAPIRAAGSKKIIAVAEIYQDAGVVSEELRRSFIETVGVVGFFALFLIVALFGIVVRACNTIEAQSSSLSERVRELSTLLITNRSLQYRIEQATQRSAESNEQLMRRIGSDLHDGPVQMIALGLLRLDTLDEATPSGMSPAFCQRVSGIRTALDGALLDIRSLCRGIAIPELTDKTLHQAIALAVRKHVALTGTTVDLITAGEPEVVPMPILISLYRFVQEGLSNAFRHARGEGQSVEVSIKEGVLQVTVADGGRGVCNGPAQGGSGLGLQGLQNRIVSLGGEFEITSDDRGVRLVARYQLHRLAA